MNWFVYLLRCRDGSLYAGVTTDLRRRLREHGGEGGRGAKYTASRKPLGYAAAWSVPDRSAALRLEARLKKLTHREKEEAAASGAIPDAPCLCVFLRLCPDGTIRNDTPEIP